MYFSLKVHQVNGTTTKTYKNVAGGSINMSAAQLDCESRNKTLASILNQEEQEAFDEVAQKQTWIGLHYNLTINKWKWSSEEPFEAWDEEGEEHFVVINTDKTWQAKNCREQEHFLCFGGTFKMLRWKNVLKIIVKVNPDFANINFILALMVQTQIQ